MWKFRFGIVLLASLAASWAVSAEEGGEHEEKKPPPKPPSGAPSAQVMKLPVVAQWKQWESSHKLGYLSAWGENISEVSGDKCWGVALGETSNGQMHVWRRFCVSQAGVEIWVGSVPSHPDDEITYTPYDKWVSDCKPRADFPGNC